jgi:hypothetical protein
MGIGGCSLRVKRPECEADHSPPSSTEVKNGEANLHSLICLNGVVLNYLSTGAALRHLYTRTSVEHEYGMSRNGRTAAVVPDRMVPTTATNIPFPRFVSSSVIQFCSSTGKASISRLHIAKEHFYLLKTEINGRGDSLR